MRMLERKKIKIILKLVLCSFLCSCALYLPLSAQEAIQTVDLSIESIPGEPAAGQLVTLRAVSYSVDLNEMNLSWVYGGKSIATGYGKTQIRVTAPTSGTTALAKVTVTGSGINAVEATLLLRPGSVDLLWEGVDSATPPFYKGLPLVAPDGLVRVVSVPAPGAPRQVNYQWSLNGSSLPMASGNDRSSIVLKNDALITRHDLSVKASAGLFEGGNTLSVPSSKPLIVAYQRQGSYIDFARGSTGTIFIPRSEATLHFEPYFFSVPRGIPQDLLFSMTAGNEPVYDTEALNELSVSQPDNGTSAELTVEVHTATYSLQSAKKIFTLLFQ